MWIGKVPRVYKSFELDVGPGMILDEDRRIRNIVSLRTQPSNLANLYLADLITDDISSKDIDNTMRKAAPLSTSLGNLSQIQAKICVSRCSSYSYNARRRRS